MSQRSAASVPATLPCSVSGATVRNRKSRPRSAARSVSAGAVAAGEIITTDLGMACASAARIVSPLVPAPTIATTPPSAISLKRRGGRVRRRILGEQPDRQAGRGELLRGQFHSPEHGGRLRRVGVRKQHADRHLGMRENDG